MEWISHRGESADAPENTLESFALARERKTDGSECDVHFTHDGKLVVCHDNTTERMGDRILNVELADIVRKEQYVATADGYLSATEYMENMS